MPAPCIKTIHAILYFSHSHCDQNLWLIFMWALALPSNTGSRQSLVNQPFVDTLPNLSTSARARKRYPEKEGKIEGSWVYFSLPKEYVLAPHSLYLISRERSVDGMSIQGPALENSTHFFAVCKYLGSETILSVICKLPIVLAPVVLCLV